VHGGDGLRLRGTEGEGKRGAYEGVGRGTGLWPDSEKRGQIKGVTLTRKMSNLKTVFWGREPKRAGTDWGFKAPAWAKRDNGGGIFA